MTVVTPLAQRLVRHPTTARLAGPVLVRRRPTAEVVVAQMGKVGSQAVVASLSQAGVRAAHVHFLDRASLRWADRVYRQNWNPRRLPWHVWEGRHAAARLRAGERLDIVTVAREPVGRNLSAFFQVADLQFGIDLGDFGTGAAGADLVRLRSAFLEEFDEHERPLRWFDDELKRSTGIDVYRHPFDRAKGYSIIGSDRARVLVLRTDWLDETFTPAVHEFLGRPDVGLVNRNDSAAKDTGELYEQVQHRLRLPATYLEQMYNSKYARHFWTPEELAQARAAWSEAWPEPRSGSSGARQAVAGAQA